MKRITKIVIVIAIIAVIALGAWLGGLLSVIGPSGSVRAFDYETDISQETFPSGGLHQLFSPTVSVKDTTEVSLLLHASTVRYGVYLVLWAISCDGNLDSGGTGMTNWDTTPVIQEWVAAPTNNAGNLTKAANCDLWVHITPVQKKGGTGDLQASDIAWRQGGNVQPCPTCPAEFTRDTIVWGVPLSIPPSPTLKTSFTYNTTAFTATFKATTSGGEGPYTYHWNYGDGTYLNETKNAFESESVMHTYPAKNGTYTATMFVTDATGQSPTQSTTLKFTTVQTERCTSTNPCTGASAPVEVIPLWAWIAIIIAGAVVVFVVIFRKRL